MDGILTNGDPPLQGEVTCKRFFQVTSDQVTERSDDAAGDMSGLSTEVCKNEEHMDAEWTLFWDFVFCPLILFFLLEGNWSQCCLSVTCDVLLHHFRRVHTQQTWRIISVVMCCVVCCMLPN